MGRLASEASRPGTIVAGRPRARGRRHCERPPIHARPSFRTARDSPLSDFTIHGQHCFPADIEDLLRRIDAAGRAIGRWPLGENWPYYPREFDWAQGRDASQAPDATSNASLDLLEAGRSDEVLLDPRSGKPFATPTERR